MFFFLGCTGLFGFMACRMDGKIACYRKVLLVLISREELRVWVRVRTTSFTKIDSLGFPLRVPSTIHSSG